MNKVILMGRLTRDPEIRYAQGDSTNPIASYTLAVDRRVSRANNDNQQTADFINCVVFNGYNKGAEFAEKYLKKGTKVVVEGRIQTRNYTNKDGQRVYVTEVVVEQQEFAESKNASGNGGGFQPQYSAPADFGQGADPGSDFMNIPEGIEEDLPFN